MVPSARDTTKEVLSSLEKVLGEGLEGGGLLGKKGCKVGSALVLKVTGRLRW